MNEPVKRSLCHCSTNICVSDASETADASSDFMSSAVRVLDCEQEIRIDTHKTSGIALHNVSRIEAVEFPKWPPPLTCAFYCDRCSKWLYQHGLCKLCGDINVLFLAHSGTYRVDQTDHATLAHFGTSPRNLSPANSPTIRLVSCLRVAGKHTTTATWPRALIYAVHLMAELAGAVYPAVFSQPAKEAK